MNWTYDNRTFTDVPEDTYGFIYMITYTDGTRYIGKKNFWREVRLKPRKTDRANAKRVVVRPTDWETYNGSSKLTKDKTIAKREILKLCRTKTDLTYHENYYLFFCNVLFDSNYMNQNIMGRFFPSDNLTGSKEYLK